MDSILITYSAIFLLGLFNGILIIGFPLTGKLAKMEAWNARLRRELNQSNYRDREKEA